MNTIVFHDEEAKKKFVDGLSCIEVMFKENNEQDTSEIVNFVVELVKHIPVYDKNNVI